MLERERDIFPLPKLAVETLPLRGQLCRTVERRILRRSHVQKQVNLAVDALNSMYFGHEHYVVPMPVRAVKELNHQSQRDTLEHLISRVHAAGAPPMHFSLRSHKCAPSRQQSIWGRTIWRWRSCSHEPRAPLHS